MQHDKLDGIARNFFAFIVRNFYGMARKLNPNALETLLSLRLRASEILSQPSVFWSPI